MLSAKEFHERLSKLWKAIEAESIPSTRHFIEWFIILGLVKHGRISELNGLLNRMLEFDQATGKIISLLTVSMHVGLKLEVDRAIPFFKTVFHRIMPWFMHNNHMVRNFALYVFDRLWLRRQTDPYKKPIHPYNNDYVFRIFDDGEATTALPEGYANMAAFISISEHNQRFLARLRKEYFHNQFDPIRDYNVQTIFFTLLEKSGICQNECISMYSFLNVNPQEGNIPYGEDQHLIERFTSLNLQSATTIELGDEKDDGGTPEKSEALLKDYQQKSSPWDSMELIDQDLTEVRKRKEIERRRQDFDVIVVASLIDRVPNLAGLSRTCEVFGATALVVPCLTILDDPNFRNISMTSEKWLDIIKVKPGDLGEYLQKQRLADYRIVAVEQSSQSHSLLYYEFPAKCCLVLGSEKEGVPADILHLVDDCVEIPQFGMIRSLNVHVSGSIILWEMRRQSTLNQAAPQYNE